MKDEALRPGSAIAILAYHFYPSPEVGAKRMSALALHFKKTGRDVTVYSAFQGLQGSDLRAPQMSRLSEINLERIRERPSRTLAFLVLAKRHLKRLVRKDASPDSTLSVSLSTLDVQTGTPRDSLSRRVLNVLNVVDEKKSWSFSAASRMLSAGKSSEPAVLIVSGPPMSAVLAATIVARRLKIPIIVDLRDPISLADAFGRSSGSQWSRRCVEKYVVRRAAYVTTTSPSLCRRLCEKYPEASGRIVSVPNGYDGIPRPPRETTGNMLTIVYAGALYVNRNPFPFLEALEAMLARADVDGSRVRVIFAGECEDYRGVSLRDWLSGRTCEGNVSILGRLDADELDKLYDSATLLLSFAEGQRMQIPAKTFEILALGRELLFLCEPDSDTAGLVRGLSGVNLAQSIDKIELQESLLHMYRKHVERGYLDAPPEFAVREYSREVQNARFADLVKDIVGGRVCAYQDSR